MPVVPPVEEGKIPTRRWIESFERGARVRTAEWNRPASGPRMGAAFLLNIGIFAVASILGQRTEQLRPDAWPRIAAARVRPLFERVID
jgi:hypothetical protein